MGDCGVVMRESAKLVRRVQFSSLSLWATRITGLRYSCKVVIGVRFPGCPQSEALRAIVIQTWREAAWNRIIACDDRKNSQAMNPTHRAIERPELLITGSSSNGKMADFESAHGRPNRSLPAPGKVSAEKLATEGR